MNKHIIWAGTIVLVIAMLCGTLIYINNNSWTVRFEMDENTLQAIESIEYPIVSVNETKCELDIEDPLNRDICSEWAKWEYNNGTGRPYTQSGDSGKVEA